MRLSNLLSAHVNEEIAMLSPKHIADAAHRLVAQAGHPAKVILFGSYARGEADEASDLDLMVVENGLKDKAAEYLRRGDAIGRTGVGVDLLPVSEQEFERRSQVPGTAAYWAKTEGEVLYDASA
jgi:predicted nucleotidyltransferase